MAQAPYGTWISPITPEAITKGADSIADVIVDSVTSEVYHLETRPSEGGRNVLVHTATNCDITGPGWNVRTRVQEYGGAPAIVHGGVAYFSHLTDGQVYYINVKEDGSIPKAVTPEGKPYRYACLEPFPGQPQLLAAVLEDHTIDLPSKIATSLVIIDTKLKILHTLVSGADFYSMPKFSPNGKRLAWWQWSHPDMPWEGGEIYVADVILGEDLQLSVERHLHVAGKKGQIGAGYPAWANDERLIFTSDETGFINPYKFENSHSSPLLATAIDEDFGQCYWMLHFFPYAILDEEGKTGVFSAFKDGRNLLYLVDLDGGSEPKLIKNPFVLVKGIRSVSRKGHQSVMFAQKEDEEDSIVQLSLTPSENLELQIIKPALPLKVDGVPLPGIISLPRPLKLRVGLNGDPLYVVYYPPRNPNYSGAIKEEKPPCIVNVHGGPTSFAPQGLNWTKQYFTSRGWAWLDVNYGGSSGYGRKYMERLQGNWGIVDTEDCILAARTLAFEHELVDPKRMVIRGSSAGGYTVLAALSIVSDNRAFAAATSLYGVSDLNKLAEFTHKFESRYLDRLIGGTAAEIPAIYKERSPIHHADRIVTPLLILQGEIDMVVPKEQAETIYNSIKERGGNVEYKLYSGEGHGWRREESMRDALERELGFYERIFRLRN